MWYVLHLLTCACSFGRHTLAQKNVTYNIALKSTTYAKINVTLDVTLQQRNVTLTLVRANPAQRTGAG